MLTQEKLKYHLNYDPFTGVFIWINPTAKCIRAGAVAGTVQVSTGKVIIQLCGAMHTAAKLAYLYMTGEYPKGRVRARDCNNGNARWDNLYYSLNAYDHVTGVSWCAGREKWVAAIPVGGGVRMHLGYFDKKGEACVARLAAESEGECIR